MITINHLSYQIGAKPILKDISMTFEAQKIYAIIGPNGAGKSTLLKHIMGIIPSPSDTIKINAIDVQKLTPKEYAKMSSFVFQENNREIELSVEEMIAMGRYPYVDFWGNLSKQDDTIINQVITDLRLESLRKQSIRTLSGGEAQKVFIARALTQQTPLLLLDEPTSMLDIHNSVDLLNQIQEIREKYGLTVIMVMHDLNLAFQYATDIVLMQKGTIALEGPSIEVINNVKLKQVYGHKIKLIKDEEGVYIVPIKNVKENRL